MLRVSDDDLWLYYSHYEKSKGNLTRKYCKANNVDYVKIKRFLNRYTYKKNAPKVFYEELISWHKKYIESGLSPKVFCKKNNLNILEISCIGTHLEYLATIERLKKERGDPIIPSQLQETKEPYKDASFFNIIPKKESVTVNENQITFDKVEVIAEKNDIELTIKKGIKVILSPSIESKTIIKIIDLLKEL
jgi:hypothetical protein